MENLKPIGTPKKPIPKKWHKQQEKILKDWGESSSCYRYMHFKAYQQFKQTNMRFTLPIIVISTVTGTANFAQETFPESIRQFVPLGIGAFNLVAAIMTTVLQFLKANELMEAHRVASIGYGKLARSIKLELQLPIYERTQDGMAMVNTCRAEYDRLVEQSPPPPEQSIKLFEKHFPADKKNEFARPEISDIEEIELFDSVKEQTAVSSVANVFKKNLNNAAGFGKKLFGIPAKVEEARKFSSAPTMKEARRESNTGGMGGILDELRALKNSGIVSKTRPSPPGGDESVAIIDIPSEEVFDEPAGDVEENVEPEPAPEEEPEEEPVEEPEEEPVEEPEEEPVEN
jgi:hypothetical protein